MRSTRQLVLGCLVPCLLLSAPPARAGSDSGERTEVVRRLEKSEQPKAAGMLTIDSKPPAVVRVDDKRIGRTPIVRHELPAGAHRIDLVNKLLGVRRTLRVIIHPGKETKLRVSLYFVGEMVDSALVRSRIGRDDITGPSRIRRGIWSGSDIKRLGQGMFQRENLCRQSPFRHH